MRFRSILFPEPGSDAALARQEVPGCFIDLNLNQIVKSMTAGFEEYDLSPFFCAPLRKVDTITFRHEVFRDLEDPTLLELIKCFAEGMHTMRACLDQSAKLHYTRQKQRWFLEAVDAYCRALTKLRRDLITCQPKSRGLLALRGYVLHYTDAAGFRALLTATQHLVTALGDIRYCLHIKGARIRVRQYDAESDYSSDVLQVFEKFKQGEVRDYRFELRADPDMNHVEAAILDLVAKLYVDVFSSLEQYHEQHQDYLDKTLADFDREIQFYVASLEHVQRLSATGLAFCYPEVEQSKEVYGRDVFDLALAERLSGESAAVVRNDFYLTHPERIFVVSGPNQGGKTTFARTFGQLHYLASLGCLVPGTEARLFLSDGIYTHFEREEDLETLSGKLEDELRRINAILGKATSESILIMNESFGSTTLNDAVFLSERVMQQIVERDMLCVSVTFLDELASFGPTTVSMVSVVDPKNPALRTFKILRQPADGLAYAAAIAEQYGLTYERVKERILP